MAIFTTEEAIKVWEEFGITEAKMEFSCGGDSMNDYLFIFKKGDERIKNENLKELEAYLDNDIFKNVTFYEASDGHYLGEFGVVSIEIVDNDFVYGKTSSSEWSETYQDKIDIKLTKKEINYLKENILVINGDYDTQTNITYKGDLLLSDDDEKLIKKVTDKIYVKATKFVPTEEGEVEEWFTYTTNVNDDNTLKIDDKNKLIFLISKNVTIVRDDVSF
jgi:hypothetical protein